MRAHKTSYYRAMPNTEHPDSAENKPDKAAEVSIVQVNVADFAAIEASDTCQASVRTQTRFALLHLISATLHSRRVGEIEEAYQGQRYGPFFDEIFASASAAVLLCAAGLEAYINEVFDDYENFVPRDSIAIVGRMWDEMYEEKPALEKFKFALWLKGVEPFDEGQKLFQDAAVLVRLRNAIMHFKPEWHDEHANHRKLSSALSGRFSGSPFLRAEESLFPRRWASHGCAKWAVESVVNFLLEFERRLGHPLRFVEPNLEQLRKT